MHTREQRNHHSCEHDVGMNRLALKAKPKIQAGANEERKNGADQLRPKPAERFGREVEEVAEGKIVVLWIFVE